MKQQSLAIIRVCIAVSLVLVYIFFSVKDLYIDVLNPDGINWHTRTQAFTEALLTKHYSDTFQAYHPGTTLMWLSGPILSLGVQNGLISKPVSYDSKSTFLDTDYYAKLSVVLCGTLLFVLTLVLLWKLGGFSYAMYYGVVLTLEPFGIGMRRLYHLDYLMTAFLFLCFLFLIYYNYRTQKWRLILRAVMFFALALLTKITAIIFLPCVVCIFFLGDSGWLKKLFGLLLFTVATLVFIGAVFPPTWKNPFTVISRYHRNFVSGVVDIGIQGKKELGTSGKTANAVLDETLEDRAANFYLASLFMRLSVGGGILVVCALGVVMAVFVMGLAPLLVKLVKKKSFPKVFMFSSKAWLTFWSIIFILSALLALSFAVKKTDRYLIVIFPFLCTVTSYFLSKLKGMVAVGVLILYGCVVVYELTEIHPYYLAYSNPLLGGIETRLNVLDDAPFGVGTYAAFELIKKDRIQTGYSGYYTLAGSKSIKAVSAGGRYSRYPSCVTDYVIAFTLEAKPIHTCVQKYVLLDTVKIGKVDYWYVYKRLNQKHESNSN